MGGRAVGLVIKTALRFSYLECVDKQDILVPNIFSQMSISIRKKNYVAPTFQNSKKLLPITRVENRENWLWSPKASPEGKNVLNFLKNIQTKKMRFQP